MSARSTAMWSSRKRKAQQFMRAAENRKAETPEEGNSGGEMSGPPVEIQTPRGQLLAA
jgi:hypothetical protein